MPRYAQPVPAAPAKKAAPAPGAKPQPASPQRGPAWHAIQLKAAQAAAAPAPEAARHSGLPGALKAGVEQLSGLAMDDVRVHRNSPEPAKLGALAYTKGSDIHLGPGQERHLPHEAWHVVQQKQGRVKPTLQMKGARINDDAALELEADLFGAKALDAGAMEGERLDRPLAAGGGTLQLKKLTAPHGVNVVNTANRVYFSGGAANVASLWRVPRIVKNTRVQLLKAIAAKGAEIGAAADAEAANHWNYDPARADDPNVAFFDPVRTRIQGQYTDGNQVICQLDVDYHFGNRWSGYVIHVVDTGRDIDSEMRDAAPDAVGEGEYSNEHVVDDQAQATIESSDEADDVTKIVGEGARWKGVAAHAGSVRDTSKIFTNEKADGSMATTVRYILFPTLFRSWAATFDKAYGIEDEVIAEKLTADNVQVGTAPNTVNAPVTSVQSTTMDTAVDISVDNPKPADANGLAAKNAAVLHYKKNAPSVTMSQLSFTQEQTGAWDAVAAGAGQGAANEGAAYMGGDVFAFLCTWTGNGFPVANGYTRDQTKGVRYTIPAYRESAGVAKARQHGDAPPANEGRAKFVTDRKAKHDERAGVLRQALATHIQTNQIADLDAGTVVTREYPFDNDEPVSAELLGDWSEEALATLAASYIAQRQERRKKALEDKLRAIRGFANLAYSEQNRRKREAKAQVERDVK